MKEKSFMTEEQQNPLNPKSFVEFFPLLLLFLLLLKGFEMEFDTLVTPQGEIY